MRRLFVALSALLLILVGIAAARDTQARDYLAIQEQYQKDYPGSTFDVSVQQLFPTFAESQVGGTFRVERCISCHVPDIATIGPVIAAERLSADFFKYEPNAAQIAKDYHLSGTHPAYITASGGPYPPSLSYGAFGAAGFTSYSYVQGGKTQSAQLPGFVPSFLNPASAPGGKVGIDAVGCIVCHNGSRLALEVGGGADTNAHLNLIVNPVYSFTAGAALYYKNCAQCHGAQGQGGVGPPLNNQDRLGFFNEDYYYRCIEYGFTDFEHYGSVMPNWGAIAPGFVYDPARDKQQPSPVRILSENDINVLIQFIRHWENYSTLP
ncbi:MAG: cytochrome c [Candidatus Dormibacteraeota bacterium]|nr:cytochrome c [Candidatus Dormibacteraeota bacterium]MBV9526254.1 cytochrome c [Candidatus Dormibacteraeota bacterium]